MGHRTPVARAELLLPRDDYALEHLGGAKITRHAGGGESSRAGAWRRVGEILRRFLRPWRFPYPTRSQACFCGVLLLHTPLWPEIESSFGLGCQYETVTLLPARVLLLHIFRP